jgi:protein-S-isoprenylcysteine O-methyltransferase Ste14
MTSRTIFPVAVAAFLFLGFVVPMARMRLRTGRSGLVLSNAADAFQPVVKTALGTLVLGAFVLAVLHAVLGPEAIGVWAVPRWMLFGGLVLAGLGTAVMIVAQAQMRDSWRIGIDTEPTALVTSGLYGHVRNPIYAGMFVALAGSVAVAPSAWSIMGAFAIIETIALQVRAEERHLAAEHGDVFRRYASTVGRFLPGIGKLVAA